MGSRIAGPLAAALAAGVLLALASCSSAQDRLARHLESAQKFAQDHKNKEALLELRSALQIDPKNADVNFRIAELLVQEGSYADAAFFYRETTRLDPKRTDALMAEAKLIMFDETPHAEELIKKVIELDPSNPLAYVGRSEIALAANDAEAALQAALTAVELGPKEPMAYMQLGIVHQARLRQAHLKKTAPPDEMFQAAVDAFRKADELFGGGMNARVELGRVYVQWRGHAKDAEAAFRSAVAVAPSDDARARAATVAAEYARASANVELLRWALEQIVAALPADLSAWDDLANVEERRQAGGGDAVYKRLLEQRPQDEEAHVRFARFMAAANRMDEAIAHLDAQAKGGADPAVALEALSALQLGRGELKAAREAVARLEKEYPNSPSTWLARGRLALSEQRYDDAAEALRRYVGSEQSFEGQRLLALAEAGRRNFPAAAAAVDAGLSMPGAPTADLLRVKMSIHDSAGDWHQVLATLNRLRQQSALQPLDRIVFARALYETGRADAGRQVLDQVLAEPNPPALAYIEYGYREAKTNPDKARERLGHVLAQAPRHEDALSVLVGIEIAAGKPEAALAQLDKAAETGPLSPRLLLLKAQVLASQKSYKAAEEEARRAFAAAPNLTQALDLLANIYALENRLPEAIASFEEADKAGALPPTGLELLARLQLALGHREQARALYERVLAARSDLPGAKNDLAFILAEDGQQLDRALTLAQEAQHAEPENPEMVDTLGFVYHKKGLDQPAVDQFRFAIELSEHAKTPRPEYFYHLGLSLRALGKDADAAAAFEKALGLDASFPQADQARRELEAAKSSAAAHSG